MLGPTVEAVPVQASLAPRVPDLNGKRLGLLANGKANSVELLEEVFALLGQHYRFADVIRRNKGDATRPAPKQIMDDLVRECDVVVTATGD